MRYATIEGVKLRLRNRLEVDPSTQYSIGQINVDENTITFFGDEVEGKLNAYLGQVYVVPLQFTHPVTKALVGPIAEKMIVVEIMNTYFQQTTYPEQGGDIGFAATLLKSARDDLQAILNGHNVYIPGVASPTSGIPGNQPAPIILPDEVLVGYQTRPDTITPNYTVTAPGLFRFGVAGRGTRHVDDLLASVAELTGVDWSLGTNPGSRAMGSQPTITFRQLPNPNDYSNP